MTLLPNEHEVLTSNENKIVLTNKRVHMTDKEWGRSYSITIFLEDISTTQTLYKSNILWLILAVLSLLLFAYTFIASDRYYDMTPVKVSFVVGLIFLALYWFSRRHIISIHSDGGKPLEFLVNKMSDQQIEHFFDKVQSAKEERMLNLFRH
jgi:hypothetical protein